MEQRLKRRDTKRVNVGSIVIGGGSPVSLQSMTNIPIDRIDETVSQIERLHTNGADIVRLALRNEKGVQSLREIIKSVTVPLVADIHFDYRLALAAIDAGVAKIRINPGNIGEEWKVREVVKSASANNVPVRIGVNGGSINRKKFSHPTPESLVDSAMENIRILEDNNFDNIIISIKSSDIFDTIEANRMMSDLRNYPIHIGLTEAGFGLSCVVQSSIVIGHLLFEGIGDTIRVSMTGDPVDEIIAGKKILESLNLRFNPVRMISCPTCGRTSPDLDLLDIAKRAESVLTSNFAGILTEKRKQITVAVMGCEVNGPGEASEADFGLAGGQGGKMLLFAKGKKLRLVPVESAVDELVSAVASGIV